MTDTLPAAVVAMIRNNIRAVMLPVIACILTIPVWGADAAPERTAFGLSNEYIRAEFNRGGLAKLEDYRLGDAVEFGPNAFQIKVDGTTLSSETMSCEMITQMQHSVAYVYKQGTAALKVEYELQPGWRFISRQLFYGTRESEYRIEEVTVFSAMLQNSISEEQTLQGGKYGVLLRLNPAKANGPGWGMFMLLQNPFMQWKQDGQMLSASYEPDMTWKKEYGLFASDRCCIGLYQLSGTRYPLSLVPEWKYIAAGEQQEVKEQIDSAEVEALANCVRAFLLFDNKTSIKFHVGWCENDYQIDAGTAEGREEYKRIITRASQIGCENLLFGPSHSDIAPFNGNADAWGWEQVLWLGLGQKIRKGEWIPGKDPIPGSVQEMLDYAKKENIKLVAYAYPTLGFMQNPEWTAWCDNKPGGYSGVDTGVRSFQDWFTDQLVAFYKQTGIGGYSFDHWWIAYGGKASSKYAQWNGCRRILETLRKRVPDVMIDGRQQYHWFGPWTWLAGSYPHPMMSDEQPGSFEAFPDLHTDRVSANRTRYVNYMLRVTKFTPVELIPGFITHQTQRSDMKKDYRHERFRPRDWDYLGWKYSLISSIGTAPMNHVVNMIPARDEEEFKNFSKQDMAFFKGWMAWTDTNRDILKNLEPIIGQPMVGRVDGTAAIVGEHGYVFLYNPNYRVLDGVFRLDGSIGLTNGSMFVLKELYPQSGRLIGKPGEGFWQYGDEARIALEGTSALVLEVIPAAGMTNKPVLFNVRGEATLDRNTVALTGVAGTIGTTEDILVALPAMPDKAILTVNGKKVSCATNGKLLSAAIPFSGTAFGHSQQIGKYDPAFKGRTYKQTFRIPKRIFSQLAERKKEWPVTYTEDDLLATWLGSDRLLLYIDIADPKEEMAIGLKINGQDVTVKKAYNSIYPNGRNRTFMGFYADLSDLKPDTVYDCEVTLPELEPGQFQGLFFENVETEYTDTIKGK